MQVMWPLPRRVRLEPSCQLPCVQLITPDDGHRRSPKHIEFRDKMKFGYLMHLVGYLYEVYFELVLLNISKDKM
jgi:hypothetical protein